MGKFAIVLIYDGVEPSRDALLSGVAALAEYGIFYNPQEAKPVVMSEGELIGAIAAKAVSDFSIPTAPTPEEWAVGVIYEQFKEALLNANYQEFSTALAIKLALEYMNETDLVKAIRVLSREESEAKISQDVKTAYHLSQETFKIIRRTHQLVCQGRHIIIR